MNQNYIKQDAWSIIEEGFDAERVKASESLFSLGNGAMGQRANFEEHYSGKTFQGSYIAGVYYPDKTRVGWWKNGYPEYFAKVLNAPNWIGIGVALNGEPLDLAKCTSIADFRRELNMKEGWYARSFTANTANHIKVAVKIVRFLSLALDEVGAIRYEVTPVEADVEVALTPYLDAGIKNEDSNWDDKFWEITQISAQKERAFIEAHTLKTRFETCTFMQSSAHYGGKALKPQDGDQDETKVAFYLPPKGKGRNLHDLDQNGGLYRFAQPQVQHPGASCPYRVGQGSGTWI
jgi:maltose phosphorylase